MHDPNATSMGALLRSQALRAPGASQAPPGPGPASGPFGLAARRAAAGGPPRPNLGMMGMGASAPGAVGRGSGLAGRRGPPGGLTLSGMKGAIKDEGNKFSDFQGVMWVQQAPFP